MLPPDTWGQTDNLPDARKAYLENAEAVAKYGVIPKTHYFDSEDAGADIYPTIERLTIGEIRDAMSPDDDYYPSESYADTDRADAVLSAENPSDDGVINPNGKEYDAKAYLSIQSLDKTVNMVGGLRESPLLTDHPLFSKTIETDFSRGKVVVDLSQTIAIPDKGFSSVVARVTIGDDEQAGYGTTVGSNTFPAVKSEDGKNWEIKLGRISAEYGKSGLYDNTEYNVYGHVSITANTVGVESSEITIVFRPGSGSIGIKRILDKTFRLNLKQIGFDINEQASLGKGKTISMKTGACAGRNFVISDCFYSSAYDSWVLTCKRQQDDTLGMLFPNNAYEIAEGDTFVLVDIAMPSLYISVAMNRLFSEGQKFLARASKIQSHYEPSIDAKVMAESGRTLREGMFMEITDEDVVDNTTDYILIDTLSIAEDESAIPTYKVTLRERRRVTYKGTPSATSATETKSVEDETEVQPNVDLTGYAKETYVNDKVSEVNNLLASMWSLDDDGNLVTDRNVIIKNNLIVTKDTSTGGTGTDQGVSGTVTGIRVDSNTVLEPTNGIVDMSNVLANLEVDVDLSNYYTKQETLAEIAEAIAGIDIPSLEGYAKLTDIPSLDGYATEAYVTDAITALNLGQYATTASLATLQTEVDNIEAILGMDEEAEGIINTWNEVKAFLGSIEVDDDLASILEGINTRIGNNTTAIGLIDGRVTVNEAAISDNATNIRNAKGEIDGLKDTKADWGTTLAHYGITDAYTKTEVAAELAKYILKEAESQTIKGDLIIEGNLVVTKDTSSGGTGSDAGVAGTLLGITVNGTTYDEPVNGILALPDYYTQAEVDDKIAGVEVSDQLKDYAKLSDIPSLEDYAKLTDIPTTMAWDSVTGKPTFATVATSGKYGDLTGRPTIPSKTSQIAEDTNLYFTNARAVNALADTLKDYVTKTALASDLLEYASKEWVNEKGYITGITLTGDDYISVNGYQLSLAIDAQGGLENTGQGLGVGNLRHKLTFGDKSFDGGADKTITAADLGALTGITKAMVTTALGYTPYNSTNPSGYISGIDRSMVASAIGAGASGVAGKVLSSTGGDLGWVSLPTSLPASDVYAWAKKSSLALADVPDLSSKYLPLSGGTIGSGLSNSFPLLISSTNAYTGLAFYTSGGTGYMRFQGGSTWGVTDAGWNINYTLIHSGNIGSYKAGDSALFDGRASGAYYRSELGAIPSSGNIAAIATGSWWTAEAKGTTNPLPITYASLVVFGKSYYSPQLCVFHDATRAWLRGVYNKSEGFSASEWHELAFTDSNVASATLASKAVELSTRQSGLAYAYASESSAYVTLGRSTYAAYLDGSSVTLRYGSSLKQGLILNSSGNVTVGGSDLAGTTYKMSVEGKVHVRSGAGAAMTEGAGSLIVGYDRVLMIDANDIQAKTDGTTAGPLYINDWGGNVILCGQNNGNVLIGTTTDSGEKLQVNGSAYISGALSLNNALVMPNARQFRMLDTGNAARSVLELTSDNELYIGAGIRPSAYSTRLFGYNIYFVTGSNNIALSITNGYNVGIGTTNPSYKLDVNGTANFSGAVSVGNANSSTLKLLRSGYHSYIIGNSSLALSTNGDNNNIVLALWEDKSASFAGAVTMVSTLTVSGLTTINNNLVVSGDTATGSDIRFKDRIADHRIALESIAQAPLFTFKWNDREDKTEHLGTSAQYWEGVAPWLVKGTDFKVLDYSTLGVAIGISLANKALNHEERIKILEKENKALKEQIRRIQYGS